MSLVSSNMKESLQSKQERNSWASPLKEAFKSHLLDLHQELKSMAASEVKILPSLDIIMTNNLGLQGLMIHILRHRVQLQNPQRKSQSKRQQLLKNLQTTQITQVIQIQVMTLQRQRRKQRERPRNKKLLRQRLPRMHLKKKKLSRVKDLAWFLKAIEPFKAINLQ